MHCTLEPQTCKDIGQDCTEVAESGSTHPKHQPGHGSGVLPGLVSRYPPEGHGQKEAQEGHQQGQDEAKGLSEVGEEERTQDQGYSCERYKISMSWHI